MNVKRLKQLAGIIPLTEMDMSMNGNGELEPGAEEMGAEENGGDLLGDLKALVAQCEEEDRDCGCEELNALIAKHEEGGEEEMGGDEEMMGAEVERM